MSGYSDNALLQDGAQGKKLNFSAETIHSGRSSQNGERNSGWRSEIAAGRQNLHTYDS